MAEYPTNTHFTALGSSFPTDGLLSFTNHTHPNSFRGRNPELLPCNNSGILPLKVFGCVCFVKDSRPSVGKLDPKAVKCVFVGYSATQKGYVCWSPVEKRLFVSMDVHFRESEPYYKQGVTSPFDDLIQTENMREGDNCERLLKIGSIPLLIPTSAEKEVSVGGTEEEGNEDEEPICVGTQVEGELKVYTRKRRKKK